MDEDDRVFRLLNVETLEVENYTLRNKPPYLATSHICSQNLFPAVRGEALRSTIGMRMVLKALRSRTELSSVRHCWADAWCINQDPDDKLQQIPLMASIYPDAEMIFITVDHKFSFTQAVWDEVMAKLKPAFQLFWKDIWDGYEHHYLEKISTSPEFSHAYNLFMEVACLPWNTRIWTAQEYILAKSAVFMGSNFQQLRLEEHHIKRAYLVCKSDSPMPSWTVFTAVKPQLWPG
jgi:Heterokaryon incompatibility protein (HET)